MKMTIFDARSPGIPTEKPKGNIELTSVGETSSHARIIKTDNSIDPIRVGDIVYSPSLQRTPLATEAQFLLARYAIETLGYRRYEWKCNSFNAPSRRAAERFGFTFEGILRQHMIAKGRNRDTVFFSILDTEWPRAKAAFESWLDSENFDNEGRQRRKLEEIRRSI